MHRFFFLFFFSCLAAVEIQVGDAILSVEVVDCHKTRAQGLMGRKELAEGKGMLFVYPAPEKLVFWMKNTLIPLSIAFFDENKKILNVADMDPPKPDSPLRTYSSVKPALYALEVPQGWFIRHEIGPGAKFSFLDQSDQIK